MYIDEVESARSCLKVRGLLRYSGLERELAQFLSAVRETHSFPPNSGNQPGPKPDIHSSH